MTAHAFSRSVRRGAARVSGALGALALIGLVNPAAQAAQGDGAKVQGSWYRPNPTCQLLIGCVDVPIPSIYPKGTIHVGVAAGIEESRAFVAVDIPQGKKLKGGTLTLPVAPASDGSVAPQTARLQACLATGRFSTDDQGVSTQSPTPLCVFTSPVKVTEQKDPAALLQPIMTVDLAPFLEAWATETTGIIAILPVADVKPTDIWHVAFSTPDREGAALPGAGDQSPGADPLAVEPISVHFTLGGPEKPSAGDKKPVADPGKASGAGKGDSGPASSGSSGEEPSSAAPPAVEEPELGPAPIKGNSADAEAPVVTAASVPVSGPAAILGYPYPGAYLVPLFLALGVVWVGRTFTADLTARAVRGRR